MGMRSYVTLTRRELFSLFVSPLAYGAAAVFLFIVGLVFVGQFTRLRMVDIRMIAEPLGYVLPALLAPILTMKLLAEERKLGTLEMLVTAPVGHLEIVLSKFTAAFVFYAAMIALTLAHVVAMLWYCDGLVDWGRFAGGYLGMLLMAGLFLSFGLFVSSLFESPALAALVGFIGGLSVLMAGFMANSPLFMEGGSGKEIFAFLLPFNHYRAFLLGLIDTRDLSYFLFLMTFFLFLSTKSLEAQRWR